jgi:dihydrofolate reductase
MRRGTEMARKSPSSARSKSRTAMVRKRSARTKRPRPTGRVHLYVGISLDGYIAAPDGGVDWLSIYSDARSGFAPFIKNIGSIVMGRTTYDHAIAKGYAGSDKMPSYVVTHRPFEAPSESIVPFTGDLPDLVAALRERHPGDIWLMGGGVVTKSFQDLDLIDIWTVAFVPTMLGDGLPMFPQTDFAVRRLKLVSTHAYPSGVIELRYERAAQKPADR